MEFDDLNYDVCNNFLLKLDQDADGVIHHQPTQSPYNYSSSNDSPFSSGAGSSNLLESSPDSFLYVKPGDMSKSWAGVPGEDFAVDGTPDQFAYGSWEEFMRWEGIGEPVSPKKIIRSPPDYLVTPQSSQFPMTTASKDQLTSASIDPSSLADSENTAIPFPFGEDKDFTFQDGSIMSSTATTSPQAASIYQDVSAWQNRQMPTTTSTVFPEMTAMSLQEQQELRNIAFSSTVPSARQSSSSTGNRGSISSSPEPARQSGNRKRKSSTEEEVTESQDQWKSSKQPPVKKTAHNMIEKRYRTNLNDKIAALRDSVPSLRVMSRGPQGNGEGDDDNEDLEGLTPAHKLNKATVLAKATEYIRHLEKRNKRLANENEGLKMRLNAFEKLAAAGISGIGGMAAPPAIRYAQAPFMELRGSQVGMQSGPQGMIQVPESMRRLHSGQFGPHYAQQQTRHPTVPVTRNENDKKGMKGRTSGGVVSKLMVGSLAGLMVLEGLSEKERSDKTPATRGLFALPTDILGPATNAMSFMGGSEHSVHSLMLFLKFLLVLGAIIYILSPSFFDSTPKKKEKKSALQFTAAPSLASPIEVRRKAWLTAIQTVWIPRQSFLLEILALGLKTLKLSLRNLIGSHGYALLTGVTEEQESARVKAWEIALDAQLGGGDAEINRSRLLLTLIASGTLPDTPARLMLRALHIRVLLWEPTTSQSRYFHLWDVIASKLARHFWNKARTLQRFRTLQRYVTTEHEKPKPAAGTTAAHDSLPPHLAKLVEMECDDVMIDTIIQRTYNLAWNRPTTQDIAGVDEGMDAVVEDFSIRAPLDALAAWWSSVILHKALVDYLEEGEEEDAREEIAADIKDAIEAAPPSSGAELRALVAKAVLGSPADGSRNVSAALKILPECEIYRVQQSTLFASAVASMTTTAGIRVALRCAMCLTLLNSPSKSGQNRSQAIKLFDEMSVDKPTAYITSVGLLGFVAAWKTMQVFSEEKELLDQTKTGLEIMAGGLRVWIGGERGTQCGVPKAVRARIVEKCLKVSRITTGMRGEEDFEVESGYGSFGEDKGKDAAEA